MQSVRTGKAPRRSSGPYSVRDALNREKPVLSRAKNSTRARACAGVWPAGAWARAPGPSDRVSEPAHACGSIAERKGQGRRRAARRVAVAACSAPWMCFTYLSERTFSPEPRNASKVQSTQYTRYTEESKLLT